jgi:YlmC/YmxH family sporulation protein
VTDLRYKDVINVRNGERLGCVSDVEVDTCTARLVSIIIYGSCRWFGLFGREEDLVIHWCDIEVIGEDTILVNIECHEEKHKRTGGFFENFFRGH